MKTNRQSLESAVCTLVCGEVAFKRETLAALCESPIESELLTALWAVIQYEHGPQGKFSLQEAGRYAESYELDFCTETRLEISPQSEWKMWLQVTPQMPMGDYRVDLAVTPRVSAYVNPGSHVDADEIVHTFVYLPTVIVECDGHDFHERTKEQAARDKKRDRYFQASGNPVLRFTGSEIYKDAWGCASQIIDFAEKASKRAIDAFEESRK